MDVEDQQLSRNCPTCFSIEERTQFLEIAEDRLTVKYFGKSLNENDVGVIRANRPLQNDVVVAYFEVSILESPSECKITIGLVDKSFVLHSSPGAVIGSYGYSAEGYIAADGSKSGRQQTYNKGSIVGCGINYPDSQLFFTLNGTLLKTLTIDIIETPLYPAVGLHSNGECVKINFGESPFKFDISELSEKIHQQQEAKIESQELPSISRLIYNYLIWHGFSQTAFEFSKMAEELEPLTERDVLLLASLDNRSQIRDLIMNGDMQTAISKITQSYPSLLDQDKDLSLALNAQIFIEMIRARKLNDAVLFAQNELKKFWGDEQSQSIIQECCSLFCYSNPEMSPIAHIMSKNQNEKVAQKANYAILQYEAKRLETEIVESDISNLLTHFMVVQRTLRSFNGYGEVFDINKFMSS